VWECREAPYNRHCAQDGFEPGTFYSDRAWVRWGKCNTLRGYEPPTGSPTLWAREGCPEEFEITLDSSYEGGEEVEFDGNVFEVSYIFEFADLVGDSVFGGTENFFDTVLRRNL